MSDGKDERVTLEKAGSTPDGGPPPAEADRPPSDPAPGRRRRPGIVYLFAVVAVGWLLLGFVGGSYQGKLGEVQKNDNAAFLPGSAESTKVDEELQKFRSVQTIPGFVVYQRESGLTDEDRAKIEADARAFRDVEGVAADQVSERPQYSEDGTAANVAVPLIGKNGDVDVQGDELVEVEEAVLAVAQSDVPAGLDVYSAGAGGLLVAFIDAFEGIDGALLGRRRAGRHLHSAHRVPHRPVLWFFPLFQRGPRARGLCRRGDLPAREERRADPERPVPGNPVRCW